MKALIIAVFPLFLLINTSVAQTAVKPFELGVIDHVQSAVLSETRTLNIYLPPGYKDTTAAYPVIYLLDGSADEDFIHTAGLVQFLNMIGKMPQSIIIGIANIDRKRDFTFPTNNKEDLKALPTTGKSAKFISFIEQELQPCIEKSYRVNSQKTIIGQSLGGLLATEILIKAPWLFNNYIIVSPSLWWDDESLLAKAPALLKTHSYANTRAFIAVGTEGIQMENDAANLANIIKAAGVTTLFYPLPAENHLTILHNSVYQAFEVLNLH